MRLIESGAPKDEYLNIAHRVVGFFVVDMKIGDFLSKKCPKGYKIHRKTTKEFKMKKFINLFKKNRSIEKVSDKDVTQKQRSTTKDFINEQMSYYEAAINELDLPEKDCLPDLSLYSEINHFIELLELGKWKHHNIKNNLTNTEIAEIKKKKKMLDETFIAKINSNLSLVKDSIVYMINDYENLHDIAGKTNTQYMEEDYSLLLYNRNVIHHSYNTLRDLEINVDVEGFKKKIKDTDKKMKLITEANPPKYEVIDAVWEPRWKWWYHLDKLDKLTKKEKETI